MEVVKRNPIPLYEIECPECKSVIRYKASEVDKFERITCPVCGMSFKVSTLFSITYKKRNKKRDKAATNADRIRAKTDEELADFNCKYTCPPNYNDNGGCERSECCENCWFNWLKEEVKE